MIEEWKDVCGSDGRYSVSNLGRLRRNLYVVAHPTSGKLTLPGRLLSTTASATTGYPVANLRLYGLPPRPYAVHRLVAMAFLGPAPPGYECAHLDGDRTHCCLGNLRWVTPRENASHKIKHGTASVGSGNGNSKLSELLAARVRADKRPQYVIAAELGVHQSLISKIKRGHIWKPV